MNIYFLSLHPARSQTNPDPEVIYLAMKSLRVCTAVVTHISLRLASPSLLILVHATCHLHRGALSYPPQMSHVIDYHYDKTCDSWGYMEKRQGRTAISVGRFVISLAAGPSKRHSLLGSSSPICHFVNLWQIKLRKAT